MTPETYAIGQNLPGTPGGFCPPFSLRTYYVNKVIKFQLDRAPERSGELHYMLFDPGVGQCR